MPGLVLKYKREHSAQESKSLKLSKPNIATSKKRHTRRATVPKN